MAFNSEDEAIVYHGRDGGVLWIDPTAQTTGGPTRDQLEPDRAAEIDDHVRFDSEQEAADFIRDSATTHHDHHHDDIDHHHDDVAADHDRSERGDRPERADLRRRERHRERRGRTDRGHDHQHAMTFADEFAAGRDRAYSPFAQRRRTPNSRCW